MNNTGYRSLLLGGIFLLALYMVGSGGEAVSIFHVIRAQAEPPPYKTYLPVIANLKNPPEPNTAPLAATSYYFYMKAATDQARLQKAWDMGCQLGKRDQSLLGKQDSVAILSFGIPKYKNGVYGASGMQVGGFYTIDQIKAVVQQFGIGYWWCVGSDFDSHLQIGVGTTNYNSGDYAAVTYGHGRAWAQMVNSINQYIQDPANCDRGCDGQVHAVGAIDIELSWSTPTVAKDWVNGYDSANLYPLYNFGAAEGCPVFAYPGWKCGGGTWTNEQVFQVTNAGPVYPLPEIYLNNGWNAEQWYLLSVYSTQAHGIPYQFIGTLTTYGACLQVKSAECVQIDNTPEQGWTQLYQLVNGINPQTWVSLRYATDIMWTE